MPGDEYESIRYGEEGMVKIAGEVESTSTGR